MGRERLIIRNFLSIKEFDWEIKDFNILTGDMGSGKSLCLKLLYFFQRIFNHIFSVPNLTQEDLKLNSIKKRMTDEFNKIFFIKTSNVDLSDTAIEYRYESNGKEFKISAHWGSKENNLDWESGYIEKSIEEWQAQAKDVGNSPESSLELRRRIFESISHDFDDKLPMSVTFIPASRAFLSFDKGENELFFSRLSDLTDFFKKNYIDDFGKEIKDILHIENVTIDSDREDSILLELKDRRNIPLSYASSGQQELFYLLWIVDRVQDFWYHFSSQKSSSIFIEEPSAHLFPQEQKEVIEHIVKSFQKNNAKKVKFFISTHSPYVLDVINNMLYKGNMIRRFPEQADRINERIKIPFIDHENISAIFIESDGTITNMLKESNGSYHLYENKILEISAKINDDTNDLHYLNNILIKEIKN